MHFSGTENPVSSHQETCVPVMCTQCTVVQRKMLDSVLATPRSFGSLSQLTIIGISRKQQWEQHISSEATHQMWRDPEIFSDKLIRHWLEWLGHLARIGDNRTPKRTLFG